MPGRQISRRSQKRSTRSRRAASADTSGHPGVPYVSAPTGRQTYGTPASPAPPSRRLRAVLTAKESYPQRAFAVPPDATEVILLRHGASAHAVPGEPFELVEGCADPPLAPEG